MNGPHDTLISERFPSLPPQLRKAARWILDHPQEVALLSMREQARLADVTPATMTRLAQALGMQGYDPLRAAHARTLRAASRGLAPQAAPKLGKDGHGQGMLAAIAGHLAALDGPETEAAVARASLCVTQARRVYCLGLRASHGVAWHLHYALSLVIDTAVLLDAAGGTGLDTLAAAGPEDLLLVVGVRPYARQGVLCADHARQRGIAVIALTDSHVSPLVAPGDAAALVVPTAAPGFLHAMTPAFAMAETLAAAVAGRLGPAALERLRVLDAHLADFDTFLAPERGRHIPRPPRKSEPRS